MHPPARRLLLLLSTPAILFTFAALTEAPQDPDRKGLAAGPRWRGPVTPTAANEVFATGDGCAMCHSASPNAIAMRSKTGDDVSPHGLWQATMMANSFRDPYWRAQVAKESAANPHTAAEVQALCIRCHAPMAHHSAKLGGLPAPTMPSIKDDPLAQDGVSCTVCHQAQPDGLGTDETFSGQLTISKGRQIFGPYEDPAAMPMQMHSGYQAVHGPHMTESALCAACHTLVTHHAGKPFKEQTPYLEWRNSIYEDELAPTDTSRSCQDCHMPRQGNVRIARNPGGLDFNIPPRPDYAAHVFVGGNMFMLNMLRKHAKELGVTATDQAMARSIDITKRQLADHTTRLSISTLERADDNLAFDVHVANLTGHKFPTGYPARRAWLHVEVRAGRQVLFRNGAFDAKGRIVGIPDERAIPHRTLVQKPEDVVVYEATPFDPEGKPTTFLTRMATMGKDNRLLPAGWQADGPHAETTKPVGTENDPDFLPGSDTVQFRIKIPKDASNLLVVAWMRYQPVPPSWVDPLRTVDATEARDFVRMYDAADHTPAVAGLAARSERP